MPQRLPSPVPEQQKNIIPPDDRVSPFADNVAMPTQSVIINRPATICLYWIEMDVRHQLAEVVVI